MGYLDKAQPVGNMSRSFFNVIYGPPNAGKTVNACKLGKKNIIITDESGHDALLDFPDLMERTKVLPFTSMNMFRDIGAEIKKQPDSSDYHLIIDTGTGCQREQIKWYMTPGFEGYLDVKRNHPEVPSQQDFLLSNYLWDKVLTMLSKQTIFDVTINCHVHIKEGEINRPKLPDSIFQLVNGKATVLGYFHLDHKGNRMIRTKATNLFSAKTKIKMDDIVTDDEFVRIIEKWRSR